MPSCTTLIGRTFLYRTTWCCLPLLPKTVVPSSTAFVGRACLCYDPDRAFLYCSPLHSRALCYVFRRSCLPNHFVWSYLSLQHWSVAPSLLYSTIVPSFTGFVGRACFHYLMVRAFLATFLGRAFLVNYRRSYLPISHPMVVPSSPRLDDRDFPHSFIGRTFLCFDPVVPSFTIWHDCAFLHYSRRSCLPSPILSVVLAPIT